jgi:hypothetical protein
MYPKYDYGIGGSVRSIDIKTLNSGVLLGLSRRKSEFGRRSTRREPAPHLLKAGYSRSQLRGCLLQEVQPSEAENRVRREIKGFFAPLDILASDLLT